jgi:predicted nuclease of predicted toxin-antitoxin system
MHNIAASADQPFALVYLRAGNVRIASRLTASTLRAHQSTIAMNS